MADTTNTIGEKTMSQKTIYNMIEERVLDQLENGLIPWRKCYHVNESNSFCVSHQTKRPYSLLNQMLLGEPGEYWTFSQVKNQGYVIKKGSKARQIFFFDNIPVNKDEDTDHLTFAPLLKYYNVFHERDIDGLPQKPEADLTEEQKKRNTEVIDSAERIIQNYLNANQDIKMLRDDRIPCFSPREKTIFMPDKCQFDSLEDYYSTAFHEMVHSTKFKLNRKVVSNIPERAKEELIAEIGSAYLCGEAGIAEDEIIKDCSAYCASWLSALKNNIKMFVHAASKADQAYKYIIGDQSKDTVESIA